LTRQAFRETEGLLSATLTAIRTCPCADGCPSCVHSPRCGSGNRPIDKAAALLILKSLTSGVNSETDVSATVSPPDGRTPDPIRTGNGGGYPAKPIGSGDGLSIRYGVLDVETRRSAEEVGGWRYAHRMGISCAVLYDSGEDRFIPFLQEEIEALTDRLQILDRVVGFNIKRFDYTVLSGLSGFDFRSLHTLDILEQVHDVLGYRLSLDHLARVTLDARKTADGLTALRWWKEGRIQEIIDYCRMDVSVTRDLYLYGLTHGYLLFRNKSGAVVRVKASWGLTAPP